MLNTLTPGEKVRLTRTRAGLSLRDLAARSGVSAATISRMERDGASTWKSVCSVAEALGIGVEELRYRARGEGQ